MNPALVASAFALPILALSSCAPQKIQPVVVPTKLSGSAKSASGESVFREVNSYRSAHGKKALVRHPGLDKLALEHSEFLRLNRGKFTVSGKNVSHEGFEGRTLIARMKYNMDGFHENVAAVPEGQSLVKAWVDSPGHERALRATWTYTGVGIVRDKDGMVFATQLFGNNALPNGRLHSGFGAF